MDGKRQELAFFRLNGDKAFFFRIDARDGSLVPGGVEDLFSFLRAVFLLHVGEDFGALFRQRHQDALDFSSASRPFFVSMSAGRSRRLRR